MDEEKQIDEEKNPSMEQILKNIRGVISGEGEDEQPDVLELTEIVNDDGSISSMTLENSKDTSSSDVLDFIDDALGMHHEEKTELNETDFIDELIKPELDNKANALYDKVVIPNNSDSNEESIRKNRLISDKTASEAEEALKILVKTVSKPISDGLEFRSGSTVEDLVIELVRPYLSKWLDSNLPSIVKHLVEKEIQKLIPKDED